MVTRQKEEERKRKKQTQSKLPNQTIATPEDLRRAQGGGGTRRRNVEQEKQRSRPKNVELLPDADSGD